MTETQRAMNWLLGWDTGASSKTILAVMLGADKHDGMDYPSDPADAGRCFRLLEIVPEWKARLHEMRGCGPCWVALIDKWGDIRSTMDAEVGIDWSKGRAAPLTYKLMKSILDPIEKQRRSAA